MTTFHPTRYKPTTTIILILLTIITTFTTSNQIPIECTNAFLPKKRKPSQIVRINDDYCDCASSGLDEVMTEACSGFDGGWAGVNGLPSAEEYVDGDFGHRIPRYQCPSQPKLTLPTSRLNDGICDCCDGSDETFTNCPDTCQELLAEQRLVIQKFQSTFTIGSKKRQDEILKFELLQKETLEELNGLKEGDVPQLENVLEVAMEEMDELKREYMNRRLGMELVEEGSMFGFLEQVMNEEELKVLIVGLCQMSGEIYDSEEVSKKKKNGDRKSWRNVKTCTPLRLAGLDRGFLWENETLVMDDEEQSFRATFRSLKMETENEDLEQEIMDLLDTNSSPDSSHVNIGKDDGDDDGADRRSSSSRSHHRPKRRRHHHRRHEDMDEEDMPYDEDFDEEMYNGHHDDDIIQDYDEEYDEEYDEYDDAVRQQIESSKQKERHRSNDDEGVDKQVNRREEEILSTLQKMLLYSSRMSYLSQARAIQNKIDSILEESSKDEEEEEEDDNNTPPPEGDSETEPSYDPVSMQMVQNSLSRSIRQIECGIDFAKSALVLLNSYHDATADQHTRKDLASLVVGIIYHGAIQTADVAELLLMVTQDNDNNASSCTTGGASSCPPPQPTQRISMDGKGSIPFPPPIFHSQLQSRCQHRQPGECPSHETPPESIQIPNTITDGFLGYFPLQSRQSNDNNDDTLNNVFSPYASLSTIQTQLSQLHTQQQDTQQQIHDLHDQIETLQDKIGMNDQDKFGPQGELHSLADSCHSISANKYTYEICFFGKSYQRESHQQSGGTDLGHWTGMQVIDDDDDNSSEGKKRRVMKWENGAKCWNGPKRSATVYVTCGEEVKLVSADEPETCSYVMEMEAYFACDDVYRLRNGLE